jgi:hypothetical protein
MRFAVTTRFVFTGTFYAEAETKDQAKEYVEKDCGFVIGGTIHTSLSGEVIDWDFPVHPEKTILKAKRCYHAETKA